MKTILIDVDDVICDNHFLPVINKMLGSQYNEEDFYNIDIEKELFKTDEERQTFNDLYVTVDSYSFVELKEGAYEVLKRLKAKHRVILLTNGTHYERQLKFGRQLTYKYQFLLTKLPFFRGEDIIFSAQKDLFVADIIIDDRAQNMTGNYPHRLMFSCFHNRHMTKEQLDALGITRVDTWKDIEQYIDNLD